MQALTLSVATLYQAELREVGALANEFGIDRDERSARDRFREIAKRSLVANQQVFVHSRLRAFLIPTTSDIMPT